MNWYQLEVIRNINSQAILDRIRQCYLLSNILNWCWHDKYYELRLKIISLIISYPYSCHVDNVYNSWVWVSISVDVDPYQLTLINVDILNYFQAPLTIFNIFRHLCNFYNCLSICLKCLTSFECVWWLPGAYTCVQTFPKIFEVLSHLQA